MTQPALEKLEDLCKTYGIKKIGIGAASFMTGVLIGGSNPDLHTAISGGVGIFAFGSMAGIMSGENRSSEANTAPAYGIPAEKYDIGNAALQGASFKRQRLYCWLCSEQYGSESCRKS